MTLWQRVRPFLSGTIRLFHISFLEAKVENQRSYLGLWWIPLSTLIFTAMLALVFRHSQVFSVADFFLYVVAGFITWNFVQDSVLDSTDAIQAKFDFALHNNLSLLGLFVKLLVDRLFFFGINLALLFALVLLLSPWRLGLNIALLLPFLAIIIPTSLGVAYLINLVTLLFPDLTTLLRVAMRFMFFLTPIFWTPVEANTSGVRGFLATYNPAAYYLSIARQVFAIEPVNGFAWLVAILISLVIVGVGALAYIRTKGFVRNLK